MKECSFDAMRKLGIDPMIIHNLAAESFGNQTNEVLLNSRS
jgi:hypothetical protein